MTAVWGIVAAVLSASVLLIPVPVGIKLYFDLDTARILGVASLFGVNVVRARASVAEDGLILDVNSRKFKYRSAKRRGDKRRNGEMLMLWRGARFATRRKGARARLKWGNGLTYQKYIGADGGEDKKNAKKKINPIPFLKSLKLKNADILIAEGGKTPVRTALNAALIRNAVDALYRSPFVEDGTAEVFEEWNAQRFTAVLLLSLKYTLAGWIGRLLLLTARKG
ncbi:MAG: hypothetical protein LBT55_06795 [Clostridiaceae bacterium]|nr:hypothetical protein [Clostridiaceae bacterium]